MKALVAAVLALRLAVCGTTSEWIRELATIADKKGRPRSQEDSYKLALWQFTVSLNSLLLASLSLTDFLSRPLP